MKSPPSLVVLLIRHGEAREDDTSYGPETPLSALGHRQVDRLADALSKHHSVTAVYASPFPRAQQSAQPLATRLGFEVVTDERLAEFQLPPQGSDEDQTLSDSSVLGSLASPERER